MPDPPKQLVFGPVIIEWDARYKFPILADLERPGWFVTQCPVAYRYGDGDYALYIREDYSFDGASIPWIIRNVPGLAKYDWHLLAALPHDYGIDHPTKIPRFVADGIFVSVLVAMAQNRKDKTKRMRVLQGYLMWLAVWTWTILTTIRNPPNIVSQPPAQVLQQPLGPTTVAKTADVISQAQEETAIETAEPPEPAKKN